MADSNIIYSPKFGPLDFSNDVWVRRYRNGDESSRAQTYAIAMNFGGKEYAFIPEDRIQKGWYADGRYNYSPAFLNENTIKSLATNAEYIDLSKAPVPEGWANSDSRVKSEDIKTYGDYLTKSEVNASSKGFLIPAEQIFNYFPSTSYLAPKFGAITGLARDPDTGQLGYAATGLGNIQAPIAKADGRVSYYEKPTGFLADLGRAILDMPPIAAMALNFVVPGLGTGIGVGRAIGLGDIEGAAKALVIGEIINRVGVDANVADATGSAALGGVAAGTTAGLLAGQPLDVALQTGAVQGAISGVSNTVAQQQATDYLENLSTPDYLSAGPATTSADVIAAFPETNPNLVDTTISDITTLPAGTVEGIKATLPTTVVGDTPIDYSLTPAAKSVTVDDVVKNIVLENLDTSLQTGTLTADQIDTALNTLTGGYTLGGTTEGIKATMPDTVVTGTTPVDYALNTITGGESLTLPTSPNLESMGGGQGLTTAVTGGVLSEAGLTPTGNVTLGDATSFINTGAPVTTNKTYTYDDGSTITVDKDGNIIGYTDATDTAYTGSVETPSSPLTKSQVEGLIKLGLGIYGTSQVANVVRDAISSGDEQTQTGFPYIPSDISGWARPEYTQTWQAPLDLNSLFTTDNLLGGTQWAGLQGNQFANIPQVSMSDFISSIQNGKV